MTTDLAEHVGHFRARVLQDALLEATAAYWRRRAETHEWVGTPEADERALACRRHAALLAGEDILAAEEGVTAP